MASQSSIGDEGWPKWKVALAIGAPVALGVAGMWLYKRRVSSSAVVKSRTSDRVVVEDTAQIPQACFLSVLLSTARDNTYDMSYTARDNKCVIVKEKTRKTLGDFTFWISLSLSLRSLRRLI